VATSPAATCGASKDSNEGGEEEYGKAGECFPTAGVELKLLLKELAPRVGGKPSAISINDGCDQAQSEYGSCMATVDEDMSEGREALESQVKKHQSATHLKVSIAHLSTLLALQ